MLEWPCVRRGSDNTGATPSTGPRTTPDVLWRHNAGNRVFGTPLIVGGRVYVGTTAQSHQDEGALVAIGRMDGNRAWMSARDAMEIRGTPVYANGYLYLGDLDGTLFVVDSDDGRVVRSLGNDRPMSPADGIYPLVIEDTLITQNYHLEVRDISSLELRWHSEDYDRPRGYEEVTLFQSPLAYAEGRLFAGGFWKSGTEEIFVGVVDGQPGYVHPTEPFVRAIDAETGETLWQTPVSGHSRGTIVIGDTVYTAGEGHTPSGIWLGKGLPVERLRGVPNRPLPSEETGEFSTFGTVSALSSDNGTKQWETRLSSSIRTMAACDGRFVCVGTNDGRLVTLKAETGVTLWEQRINQDYAVLSSPTIADDTVYIGSNDSAVLAFDLETGNQLWRFETNGAVDANAAIVDGILYIADNHGTVYALE